MSFLKSLFSLFLCLIYYEYFSVNALPVLPSITLYTKATDGFQCFRVPALLTTPKFIFAFAEGRNNVPNPETCEFDETCLNKTIVVKRSADYGNTWSAMDEIVTVDCGVGGECGYENAVFDNITNVIFLTYVGHPGSFIISSADFGETWSAPTNLSSLLPVQARNSAPGHGIQIDSSLCTNPKCCPESRLIIPYECYESSQNYACLIYSDDHGATWQLGGYAQATSRENEVVQIVNGKDNSCVQLYVNSRDYNKTNGGARYGAWSSDSTLSFSQLTTTNVIDPITPKWTGAVAGLHRLTMPSNDNDEMKSRILLSHPNNPTLRENLTIHVSYDEGTSWNSGKVMDSGPSGYSDLTKLPNGNAAILYERGNITSYDFIDFVVFDADWVDDI